MGGGIGGGDIRQKTPQIPHGSSREEEECGRGCQAEPKGQVGWIAASWARGKLKIMAAMYVNQSKMDPCNQHSAIVGVL